MLQRLARACLHHRWITIGAWVLITILLSGISNAVGPDWRTDFTLPNGEAKEVQQLLEANSPEDAGTTASIVSKVDTSVFPDGIEDPTVKERLEAIYAIASEEGAAEAQGIDLDAENAPAVDPDGPNSIDITTPYENPQQVSEDTGIAFASLAVADIPFEDVTALGNAIRDRADELPEIEGLQVEYGGDLFAEFVLPESEIYGVLAAVIILIVAFGSVLAMGLPIGIALFGLGCATAIVTILSHPIAMPDFTTAMVAMIGLGVGIDYALFIVTRYREALHAGASVEESTVEALDTSGRAVIFAGTTVIIALLGLSLMGLAFVTGVAIASAIAVFVMIIGSLTLLPALLGLVGARIDNTSRAALIAVALLVLGIFVGVAFGAGAVTLVGLILAAAIFGLSFAIPSLRKLVPRRKERPREQRFWYRWSRVIQHRPWPSMIIAVVILLLLAAPFLSIRLGFGDYGNSPEDTTVRKAYDLMADGFGPGTNGPIIITVEGDTAADPAAMQAFVDAIDADEDVAFSVIADPPPAPDVALVITYPNTAPQDAATTDLVSRLRDEIIPSTSAADDAKVGGATAGGIDFASYLAGRMPLLIGVVLLLSFILLMAVFRSLLVPLKAVVMNLLSIGAAYGVLVAVFQYGWLSDIIGVDKTGPIDAWIPMFLFAIVFGLSMDYEVFLLSRIKEEYDKTVRRGKPDNGNAVADGLAITARVITAAALIMFCVFFAFVLGDERALKMFGLGLAIAVLIDATVVRMLLVPATMELLGDRNWWIPKWLNRILPKIDVEGHHRPDDDEPSAPPPTPPTPLAVPEAPLPTGAGRPHD